MKKRMIVLSLVGVLASGALLGQDADAHTPITINSSEARTKFHVLDNGAKTRISNDLMYYWMKSQQLHATQGGFEGRLLDGPYSRFFPDNQLFEQGQFMLGLKHGTWKSWYQNGHLKTVQQWREGRLHGTQQRFDEQGRLLEAVDYKYGVRHGKSLTYGEGKLLSESTYKKGALQQRKEKKVRVRKQKPEIIPLKPKTTSPEDTPGQPEPEAAESENKRTRKWWWPFGKRAAKPASDTPPTETPAGADPVEKAPR